MPDEQADPAQPPPEYRLQVDEETERIWAAVARLGSREATTIELYYRQEWSLRDIAEALDCPVGTVKTLLFRARERLRQALNE